MKRHVHPSSSRRPRAVPGLLLAAACDLAVASAFAESAPVRLRWLRSAAASACSEQPEVETQVRQRLGRDPFGTDAHRIIEASVDVRADTWHVDLQVKAAGGKVLGRRVFDVRSESCDPVVEAVSLSVALAIDPDAQLEIDRGPVSSSGFSPSPDVIPPVPQTASTRRAQAPLSPKVTHPYAILLTPLEAPCEPPSDWRSVIGIRAIAAAGLLPNLAGGVSAFGLLGQRRSSVALGVSFFPAASLNRQFSFGLTTVDIGYCHDLLQSSSYSARTCALSHIGAEHSVVHELTPRNPGDRLFAAASLEPQISLSLAGPLFLELGAAAWVPFVRPQFMVGDNTVFQTHSVAGLGYLGIGLRTN